MEFDDLGAGFLRVVMGFPSDGALSLDDRALEFGGEAIRGSASFPKFLDVGDEFLQQRVDPDGIDGLGAREDDAFGIVLDAGAPIDVHAVCLEVAPHEAEAFRYA